MNDKIKIITGLVIFAVIVTSPIWMNACKAKDVPTPVLSAEAEAAKVKAGGEGGCVLPKAEMAKNHMELLDGWRNTVVREGQRVHLVKNEAGEDVEFDMSLSNTCLSCHTNKAEFCDKCHDYASVNPYCWDCHVDPNVKED